MDCTSRERLQPVSKFENREAAAPTSPSIIESLPNAAGMRRFAWPKCKPTRRRSKHHVSILLNSPARVSRERLRLSKRFGIFKRQRSGRSNRDPAFRNSQGRIFRECRIRGSNWRVPGRVGDVAGVLRCSIRRLLRTDDGLTGSYSESEGTLRGVETSQFHLPV